VNINCSCLKRAQPYLIGAAIGLLGVVTLLVADKPLGMSTAIAQTSGACAMPILGQETVAANAYWSKKAVPRWDYSTLFLLGSGLGALAAALLSRSFHWETVPSVWRERFGSSVPLRMAAAFAGGFLILFGARMADGCTSGHGIAGTMQLAVSSWTFFLVMFVSGVATAMLMFKTKK